MNTKAPKSQASGPSTDRRNSIRARLFDEIPSGVAVLDRSLTVVDHNRAFADSFGESRGRLCHEAIAGLASPCEACPAPGVFTDGHRRAVEQTGTDLRARSIPCLAQIHPIEGPDGRRDHVAAILTDISDTRRLQHEYQTLFEKVPCFVALINRDKRVVKANEAFRRVFGEPTGEECYTLFKRRHEKCEDCPVDRTFADGQSHTGHQAGISRDGRMTPYVVFTAPVLSEDGDVTHVIEMALDLTEHHDLELRLERADVLRYALVENSVDAIVLFDEERRVMLANRAAEELLGVDPSGGGAAGFVPRALSGVLAGRQSSAVINEVEINRVPLRMSAVRLDLDGQFIGTAVFAQDQREIKRLEQEKVEAERMAAVGQTVAGLAHGIKNIITGLEGGMYVTSSGLKRGDQERIERGWDMLVRNMGRISALTRNLLAFSRGERLEAGLMSPSEIVHEVVSLYADTARRHGIEISAEVEPGIADAIMDAEGIHSCLANLISNAVDACQVSDQGPHSITVRLIEDNRVLAFEVVDTGCGMDYEIKKKAFTSFFTTKGGGGTGLGLLQTRKIVQQHGGTIELESEPGHGSSFRLLFPRNRLPKAPSQEDPQHG